MKKNNENAVEVWVNKYGYFNEPTQCIAFAFNGSKLVYVRYKNRTHRVHYGYVFNDKECKTLFDYNDIPLCLKAKQQRWLKDVEFY